MQRKNAAKVIELAKAAEAGRHEHLECPECGQLTVSVWYTHPEARTYFAWFVCEHCQAHSKAVMMGDPPTSFRGDRINKKLEAIDEELCRKAKP